MLRSSTEYGCETGAVCYSQPAEVINVRGFNRLVGASWRSLRVGSQQSDLRYDVAAPLWGRKGNSMKKLAQLLAVCLVAACSSSDALSPLEDGAYLVSAFGTTETIDPNSDCYAEGMNFSLGDEDRFMVVEGGELYFSDGDMEGTLFENDMGWRLSITMALADAGSSGQFVLTASYTGPFDDSWVWSENGSGFVVWEDWPTADGCVSTLYGVLIETYKAD